ncbi:MAG: N-acyl homoserine lactonase family protein [Pseudomonadota bacterium]
MTWEVYAVKYADRADRTRSDSFLFDPDDKTPHPIDYFFWVLRQGSRVILVDTGYDEAEAVARGRPIRVSPVDALLPLGLSPSAIDDVIVTHLHYDHAGGLALFPNARLHMQAAEMMYATGPCMCFDALRHPYTGAHVAEAVLRLYSGRVVFYDGDGAVCDGVTVHKIGGHARGLQAVRVLTEAGYLCLASDTAHFYGNFLRKALFPIVVDAEAMLEGFGTVQQLASNIGLVVPGHDPLVREMFPQFQTDDIVRLDKGPLRPEHLNDLSHLADR